MMIAEWHDTRPVFPTKIPDLVCTLHAVRADEMGDVRSIAPIDVWPFQLDHVSVELERFNPAGASIKLDLVRISFGITSFVVVAFQESCDSPIT